MPDGVYISIRSNRIQKVLIDLTTRVEDVVDAIATDIQTRASSLAPVDTGSLRNSIYKTNGEDSDYRDKAGSAKGLNDDAVIVAEVDPDLVISPSGDNEATYTVVIGSAVEHGPVQEFGTAFVRAQPFMLPAALGLQNDFVAQMERVADGL